MILANVNIGTGPSAGDGDPLRTAFTVINQNFTKIQSNVNALTNSVTTVAGRTGNVTLTTQDIIGIGAYANTAYMTTLVTNQVNALSFASNASVDAKIAANIATVINGAPGALNTLKELADALGNDANLSTTITNQLSTLTSNAAAQAGILATLTANAAVQAGLIASWAAGFDNLAANAGAQSGSIADLTANAAVQAGAIATLTSNAAVQAGAIANLQSDVSTLTANAGAQADSIATLTSNAAAQSGTLASLTTAFNNLAANAGAQSGSIASLISNAAVQAGAIADTNTSITTANLAMKGYVDAVTTAWTANAGAQAGAIVTANLHMKNYVDSRVGSLVDGATSTLDTLKEIADALGNDANLSVTLTNLITSADANVSIANLAMKGYVDSYVTTLTSNAAVQAGAIATLTSNAAAQAGSLASLATAFDNLASNAGVQSGSIATLTANAAAQAGFIADLTANDAVQAGQIATLISNAAVQAGLLGSLGAVNLTIIQSNISSLESNVTTLTSNAAAQAGALATLTSNAAAQAGTIASIQSDIATLTANAGTQSGEIASLTANAAVQSGLIANLSGANYYTDSNVAAYLPTYAGNVKVDNIIFDDLSEQHTAYTGVQWRSNLTSNVTVKPSWLGLYPDGQKTVLDTNFGFDAGGMWLYGTSDNEHGYPVRTTLHLHETDVLEVIATINFAHTGDDHGLAIFSSTATPFWRNSTDATRIAFQFNSGIPLLYGQTTSNTAPGSPVLVAGNYYTIKFTYDPTNTVTVETYSGNTATGSAIDTRTISEVLPAGDYVVGFDADQDVIGNRSYFTNLTVRTLTNTVVNELEVVGNIAFADNSIQSTAYTATYANASPTPTSIGTKGDIVQDGTYMYHCIAANTWVRTSITASW